MNKEMARLLRNLISQRKEAQRKQKKYSKKLAVLTPRRQRLFNLLNEMKAFSTTNKGADNIMFQKKKDENIDINSATGTWIVSKREQGEKTHKIELTRLAEIIALKERPLKLLIELPDSKQMVGDDGKEVTFNLGDLITCAYAGDINADNEPNLSTKKIQKHGFHFANLAPSGDEGYKMYATALAHLGIKEMPGSPDDMDKFTVVEGNFRRRSS